MAPVAVRFYFDVVCPYSYLESRAVEAAEDEGRVAVEWLPLELRPAPRRLLEPRGEHLRVDWTRNVYRRALAAGVEIHLPRHQPRSTLPLAACLWATEAGRLRPFLRALYDAFFCAGEDVADERQIGRAAGHAGLDPDEAVRAAFAPERVAALQRIRAEADAAGVRGVPSILTPDGRTHWGMGGLDRLRAGEPLVPRPEVSRPHRGGHAPG